MIITGSILVDRNLSPTFPRFLQLATILGNFLAGLRYRFLHPWGAGEQNPSLSTRGSALGPGDADRRQPPHVRPAAAVGEAEALWQHQRRARPPRLCPRLCGGESRLLKGPSHTALPPVPGSFAGWMVGQPLSVFFPRRCIVVCRAPLPSLLVSSSLTGTRNKMFSGFLCAFSSAKVHNRKCKLHSFHCTSLCGHFNNKYFGSMHFVSYFILHFIFCLIFVCF